MKLVKLRGMNNILRSKKSNQIKLIHKFAFGDIGNRTNRTRLRSFSGSYAADSRKFKTKTNQIKTDFQLSEFISIANVLCLDYS